MPAPQYTRQQILNQNTNDFPNNNGGLITPAILRDYNANVANSVLFLNESVSSSISASYADFALTASYALNATTTSSYALQALSSSYAGTASVLLGSVVSASYAATADNAQKLDGLDSTSFVGTGSYNIDSASFNNKINSLTSATSSYITAAQTASMSVLSSSFALKALTASYANNADTLDGLNSTAFAQLSQNNTFTGVANFNIVSASNAYVLSASIDYLTVIYQTSSIIVSSGSNVLGDAAGDTQTLWGTVDIKTGPVIVTGSVKATLGFTGSLSGNADTATTAATASTVVTITDNGNTDHKVVFVASGNSTGEGLLTDPSGFTYNPNQDLLTVTASYALEANNATSASNAATASYVLNAVSASFATTASHVTGTVTVIGEPLVSVTTSPASEAARVYVVPV